MIKRDIHVEAQEMQLKKQGIFITIRISSRKFFGQVFKSRRGSQSLQPKAQVGK
jgi:hypothetical protein